MVLLESQNIKIGIQFENFNLEDTEGNRVDCNESYGKNGCIIIFTCNHCPYAIAVWSRLIAIAEWAKSQEINTLAINPNINPHYPEDNVENMKDLVKKRNLPFPYLIDINQEVAKKYKAQCTPDIYYISGERKLFYHGRLDDDWQNEKKVTHESLKEAIQLYLDKKEAPKDQKPSMGCSIKWL